MFKDWFMQHKDIQPKNFGDYSERCYPVSTILKLMEDYEAVLRQTHISGWKRFAKDKPEYMQCCIIANQYGSVHEAQYTGEANLFAVGDERYEAQAWMPLPIYGSTRIGVVQK